MGIITSIDLGSNSFRVLRFDCDSKRSMLEFEKTVGTADGLAKTGNISEDAIKRIVEAINESVEKLSYNPSEAIAVTTQAIRVAKNKVDVLKALQTQTGVNFQIIDGTKEAKLTLLAMQYALKREKLPNDKFVLLDIGGGSTELIIYNCGDTKIKSFSFGIVTLTQSKNKQRDLLKLEKEILEFIKIHDFSEFSFIATAGTPTTIAAISHGLEYSTYDKTIVNGTKLYIDDVIAVQNSLQFLSKPTLIKKVGLGREEYIDTGVDIFKLFYKILKKEYAIIFDDGLREGVAINHCLAG